MLRFINKYSSTISVAIMKLHRNCPDGGDWDKSGWWVMAPGESKVPYGGDLDDLNRYFYFYAFSNDGRVWDGPFLERIPWRAFNLCENTATSDSREVGFRQLDIGSNDSFTVNLL